MIGLIDYGRGNLRSVEKALERVGASVTRIENADGFQKNLDAIVLPGVGAFGDAMRQLDERRLVKPIREWLEQGKTFLGLCLGYQLLFESSEESPNVKGLGFLKGKVVRFPTSVGKVPHMGWNHVFHRSAAIFSDLENPSFFYHVHSYYPEKVNEEWIACETEYAPIRFASGISNGKISGFQFHPEKSQENGRKLLANFVKTL